ncbi:MAG TPA: CheR family methyltransferase, partial [Nitriliruptorales bacterium]
LPPPPPPGRTSLPGGFDVIFCRNVLIYLTAEAVAEVVGRLTVALAPGGWLLTASTDPHLSATRALDTIVTPEGVAYRRATRPSGSPSRTREPFDRSAAARPARGPARTPAASTGARAERPPAAAVGATSWPRSVVPPDRPTDAESAYRRAIACLEEGRWGDAARAARNALYLEPELVVAHVALGRARLHLGDLAGTARAWRHARVALERSDAEAPVTLAGGTSAGRLLAELAVLTQRSPVAS